MTVDDSIKTREELIAELQRLRRQADRLSVKLTVDVQFDRLEPLLKGTIYRVVQEAIANLRRHSQSDRAEIRLTRLDDRIHIEIQDWGIGFDPASVIENRFGLQGTRECPAVARLGSQRQCARQESPSFRRFACCLRP